MSMNVASGSGRGVREGGFTIVEVLVAVLLLAVVASGVALAVASTVHMSVVSNANERQQAAAKRVFEYLRVNRGWMSGCPKAGTTCTPAIPASVLEDRGLRSCTGGTFSFRLVKVWARAVHSTSNATNARDLDTTAVDFYRVHVEVGSPAAGSGCNDMVRLGLPATPSVYESAMDQKGNVPHGSLVVEICQFVNQHDDRADLGGCRSPHVTLQERPCPNFPASYWIGFDSPFKTCDAVVGQTAWLTDPPTAPLQPSTSLWGTRYATSFTITGPGSYSSSGHAVPGETGLYRFDDLPSGTYHIKLGSIPANYEIWQRKAVPAVDSGGTLVAVVQPDVSSRALVPLRPKRQGRFGIRFSRRVSFYSTHKAQFSDVDPHIPTEDFELDNSGFNSWKDDYIAMCDATDLSSVGPNVQEVCSFDGIKVAAGEPNCKTAYFEDWETNGDGNKYSLGYTGSTLSLIPYTGPSPFGIRVCTFYDFHATLYYYYSTYDGYQTWGGARVSADYTTGALPTGRDLDDGKTTLHMSRMTVPSSTGKNLSASASTRWFDSPLTAGLDSGLYALNGSTTVVDKFGNVLSADSNNETYKALPPGLKKGIWVNPNGSFEFPGSGVQPRSTVFPVVGKGECYWNANRSIGPCNRCNPLIQGLGWFGNCFVLYKVKWRKHLICEAYLDSQGNAPMSANYCDLWTMPADKTGTDNGIATCPTTPQFGDHTEVAPNCTSVPPPPPPCQGGCSSSGSVSSFSRIPAHEHVWQGGRAHTMGAGIAGS